MSHTKDFDLAKPNRPIQVGVVLMAGTTEILDVAPIDLLNSLSKHFFAETSDFFLQLGLEAQALDIDFCWVNQDGSLAKLTAGMVLQPTHSFENCPPLDIVLMGAHNMSYTPSKTELDFVRKAYEQCAAFLMICAGSVPALMAGVLNGHSATAPRPLLEHYRRNNPEVDWVEKRWHQDGKLWTSGTLLNGLDLIRAFCEQTWGSGEGTLVDFVIKLGAWPDRDNNYGDLANKAWYDSA